MKNTNTISLKNWLMRLTAIYVLNIISATSLFAQYGAIDLTYGRPVTSYGDSSRFASDVRDLIVLPNQQIIVAGLFTTYNNVTRNRITLLNADGTNDTVNFTGSPSAFNNPVYALALQSTGEIIAGGNFTTYSSQPRSKICRLMPNGTIDASFTPGTGFNGDVFAITVQPDGKILVGGSFTSFDGNTCNRIARLNSNGTYDNTFITGTGFPADVRTIAIDGATGKVYVGGNFTTYNGTNIPDRIVRLDATGVIDPAFVVPGNGFNGIVYKILLDPTGSSLMVGGNFLNYGPTVVNHIVKLTNTGTIDASFSIGGGGFTASFVYNIQADANGNFVCVGDFSTYNNVTINRVCRLTSTGALDNTFYTNGGATNDVYALGIQNNGSIIFGGQFMEYNKTVRNRIARLKPNGDLDKSFYVQWGFDYRTYVIKEIAGGKKLYGGDFGRYEGTSFTRIIRLHNNSDIDTSFHPGTGANAVIRCMAIDATNNKIYIGGDFSNYDGTARNRLARLNWDGTLDQTFNVGSGFNNIVYTLALQPDGKIVVGGSFTSYDGSPRNRIVRLDNIGSIDVSFTIGTGFNNSVYSVALQPDGKIVAGGFFINYNSVSANYIARLNSDGTFDNSLIAGNGFSSSVNDVLVQPDGKIVACGDFSQYNSINIAHDIARIDANGTFDAAFNTNAGTGFSNYCNRMALQTDGKIIVTGFFNTFNGISSTNLVRINADGSNDNTFSVGLGLDQVGVPVAIQPDGAILIGGFFTKYNTHFVNRLARLISGTGVVDFDNSSSFYLYPNPTHDQLTVMAVKPKEFINRIEVTDIAGKTIFNNIISNSATAAINTSTLSNGVYILIIHTKTGSSTHRFVKN